MTFEPPITERTTKELLSIIGNDEKWAAEIQRLAEDELFRRKLSRQTIEQEKQKRIDTLKKLEKRSAQQFEKNSTESYTLPEMAGIVSCFPFSILLHLNPLKEFWRLDAQNYKKKIWQRVLLIIVSLFMWFRLLIFFI